MQRIIDELYVFSCSFDHDVSKGKQAYNHIMELIVFYHKLFDVVSSDFVGCKPYFLYFF